MTELNMASVGCVRASSINVQKQKEQLSHHKYGLHAEDGMLDSRLSMDFLVLQSYTLLN